jgi:phospholipid N-methyltransferase
MRESFQFFRAFARNPFVVGSILPSSRKTAAAMAAGVHVSSDSIVLEIGCGTGALTEAIREILPEGNCYLGIEINDGLVKLLRERFPDLRFVCGDAGDAFSIHQQSGLGKVGTIVSGLPFTSLPKETSRNVFREIDRFMAEGCAFRTIQYEIAYRLPPAIAFRRRMEERYGKAERSRLIWRNVPPVYTLTWRT